VRAYQTWSTTARSAQVPTIAAELMSICSNCKDQSDLVHLVPLPCIWVCAGTPASNPHPATRCSESQAACTTLVARSIVVDGGVIAWIRTDPPQGAKTLTQAPNGERFPSPPLRSTCASSHRHVCHTRPEPTARLDGGELVLLEGACAAHTSLICPRANEMGAPSSNAGGHYPRRVPEELQSAPAPFRDLPAGHLKPG